MIRRRPVDPSVRSRRISVMAGVCLLAAACSPRPPVSAAVYTPAHATVGEAVRAFLNLRPAATQPIPFPHKIHIEKQAMCTDCHETVERGPIAGIPSVKTCMICHSQIATDRPLIKEVTGYSDKGVEIPWQRVYGFTHEAHVRFNHAPHIRASVDCATCHGDVTTMTVAERSVDHTMGFCVNCHRQKNAPNDCMTCHF
jgi:Cytochrome c7 and related cytochrome c